MAFKIPFINVYIGEQQKPTIDSDTLAKLEDLFKDKYAPKPVKNDAPPVIMPTTGGRVSEPEISNMLELLIKSAQIVQPDYEMKLVEALEHLAKYNPDLSYAIDNIVQLGSTEYTICFDEDISEQQATEMTSHLKSRYKSWYTGGMSSLINDLLAQCALTGAISGEIVPTNNLDGVKSIVLVNPAHIKFAYDFEMDKYVPYQQARQLIYGIGEHTQQLGLIQLNPITYKYYAIRRFNEKPYAIPPYLAALENIAIERNMVENLQAIVKKLGLLGFLEVLVKQPQQLEGETPTQYKAKTDAYLQAVGKEMEKSLKTGTVVGFEGLATFDLKAAPSTAAGAKELFELNTQMKMAGLKQDPLMLGRNFNTTETIARVIIAKLSTQVVNYQRLVAEFIEDANLLELNLAGWVVTKASIELAKPMLGDELKDQQAYNFKILNNETLKKDGIITQQQYANNVGYDEAAEDGPLLIPGDPNNPNSSTSNPPTNDNSNAGTDVNQNMILSADAVYIQDIIQAYEGDLGAGWSPFEYGHSHTPNHLSFDYFYTGYKFNKFTELLAKFFSGYFNATKIVYDKAVLKSVNRIAGMLLKMNNNTPLHDIQDKVIASLYSNWKTDFTKDQKKVIDKWTKEAYKEFKQDKSIFGGKEQITLKDGTVKPIPASTFGLKDLRTIEYYKNSDSIYLGRFITDPDTKKKISDFIKDEYIKKGLPLDNKSIIDEFRKKFADVLQGEDWKITRIINTSLSNMKDAAGIDYMQQAGVVQFERVEIIDRKTCVWCVSMNGRKFDVKIASDRLDKLYTSDPQAIKTEKPFITSVYKKDKGMSDEEFKIKLDNLTDEQIQGSNVEFGALHPSCRGTSVAVLD